MQAIQYSTRSVSVITSIIRINNNINIQRSARLSDALIPSARAVEYGTCTLSLSCSLNALAQAWCLHFDKYDITCICKAVKP